jgi:endo-1,4-beta-D-glucanase Y
MILRKKAKNVLNYLTCTIASALWREANQEINQKSMFKKEIQKLSTSFTKYLTAKSPMKTF